MLEVAQELGRRWPKVDPQTKETYVQRAKEEKAKYIMAKKSYTPSQAFLSKKNAAIAKALEPPKTKALKPPAKIVDRNAPKRPLG